MLVKLLGYPTFNVENELEKRNWIKVGNEYSNGSPKPYVFLANIRGITKAQEQTLIKQNLLSDEFIKDLDFYVE